MTTVEYSPSPWSYDYSPYLSRQGEDGIDSELPAFEIFDANCDKIFDTNEDTPANFRRRMPVWGGCPKAAGICRHLREPARRLRRIGRRRKAKPTARHWLP